jgi:hypothetical protein
MYIHTHTHTHTHTHIYFFHYGEEGTSLSLTDVNGYVIIRNLLYYIFRILHVFIRQWQIKYYYTDFLSHKVA